MICSLRYRSFMCVFISDLELLSKLEKGGHRPQVPAQALCVEKQCVACTDFIYA